MIRIKKFHTFLKSYKIIYKFWKILRKLLWLERYCNCQNKIKKNVDLTFEQKYSKYKITYHIFISKILKMYETLIALSTYVIFYHSKMLKFWCKFQQLFHHNDVFSRNYFWLGRYIGNVGILRYWFFLIDKL